MATEPTSAPAPAAAVTGEPPPSAADAAEAADPAPYRHRWWVLAVVLAAEIMDLLDSTITNVAAPAIRNDLGGSYATIQWIAAGYTLAYAVGLITGGRLGDLFGRRRMFIIGAAGFTAASLVCALAVSPAMLIGVRTVQGAFGAVLIPQGLGLLREVFPPREQAAAFGAFGPVMGLAAVCGPIVAGALIGADLFGTGWRMVFGINLPVGLLAVAGAVAVLPRTRQRERGRLDPLGMLLVTTAAFALVFPLVQGRDLGWPAWCFGLMAAALPLGAGFTWYELRRSRSGRTPLVVMSIFRRPGYLAGLTVLTVFFVAMTGLLLAMGLLLQIGLGFTALHAGLTYVPWSLGLSVGAALAGAVLAPRFGRRVLHAGVVVMAAGLVGVYLTLRQAGADVTSWDLVPALAVTGTGMGLMMAPLFDLVLARVADHEVGSASGVLNAGQQLATSLGVAVLGTLLVTGLGSHASGAARDSAGPLHARLAAAAVAEPRQEQLTAALARCVHDHAAADDPAEVPPSCTALAAATQTVARGSADPAAVARAVAEAGTHANRTDYTRALQEVLLVVIGMLGLTFLLAFAMPQRARESAER